jgi:biotin carboxyl carrier protein
MPGRVVQVHVAPGAAVTKGQPLLVIEAMKMENVVRAPRDGRVVSVAVEAGTRVVPGQTLIEIE